MYEDIERKVAQALGFEAGVNYFSMSTRAYGKAVEILGPIIVASEELRDVHSDNLRQDVEMLRRKLDNGRTAWDTYLERNGGTEKYEDDIGKRMTKAFSTAQAQLTALQRIMGRADERTRPDSYRL